MNSSLPEWQSALKWGLRGAARIHSFPSHRWTALTCAPRSFPQVITQWFRPWLNSSHTLSFCFFFYLQATIWKGIAWIILELNPIKGEKKHSTKKFRRLSKARKNEDQHWNMNSEVNNIQLHALCPGDLELRQIQRNTWRKHWFPVLLTAIQGHWSNHTIV